MTIIFETPRLILRPFTGADSELIFALNSDPEVLQFVHEAPLQDLDAAHAIITHVIQPQYANGLGRWAVHTKNDYEFLGWCGLKYRADLDEIDLGYRFKKSAWGKGYATEAAEESIRYGFEKKNLKIITGRAHIKNHLSIHVLEKIGMQFIREEIVDDCPVKKFSISNTQ